jgi:AcrR family transcriptional regulator
VLVAVEAEVLVASAARMANVPSGKLRPGPGLPAQEVASHQRQRIYAAMIEIVGEEGYSAVTVRQLSRLAGVSTRAFYTHFEDKEECFLRTYEAVVGGARERIAEAQGDGDWRERLRRALEAFAQEIETRPCVARLALVEAFSAGPAVLERMRSTEQIFETMIAESFDRAPGDIEVPPLLVKGVVAGISCTARSRLLAGRERELPGLASELLDWALAFHSEAILELAELDRSLTRRAIGEPSDIDRSPAFGRASKPKSDERELILAAVSKLAYAEGYNELTVQRICAAAGIRRRAFEAHFEGVTDCFLAALELCTYRVLGYANGQAVAGSDWAGGVNRATAALCEQLARDPFFAKLAFVEAFAPGPDGVRCREGILGVIVDRFRLSGPPTQCSSALAAEASVGAVWGILHHYVTSGRAQQLPRLIPTLSFLALAPAIGPTAATQSIRQEMGA